MRRATVFILLLPLLVAALCSWASAQQGVASSDVPKEAGFRLKGLDGKFYDTSEMKGDVVVASFGATWCTPCTWELVAIEELKEEYAGKPVKFLWVNIEDTKRTTNNVLRYYVKDRRLTIPVLRDPGGQALAQFTAGARIPVMVFFDREGRLSAPVQHGMQQDIALYKQAVRERVNALLGVQAEKSGAKAATK
jgi:thiol-disulfide isomerase/thioredoxin